jgi:omega-6 fatty acid desaturase (delta-12 desaturase)
MHTSYEKELILSTKPFSKEIRWKSWYFTLSTTILLIASLFASFLLPGIIVKLFFSILSALLLSRMFIIFHDFQHHTILYKSFSANILFTIFGAYMITPPSIWKRSHNHHHNNNAKLYSASIGSYPIMTKQKFYASNKKEQKIYLAIRHPLNMFFSYFTMFMFGMCVRSFLSSKKRHWDSAVVLLIHFSIAIFLWVHFGWQIWFFVFFLPFFLSHMLGAYLFYAQHNFPGAKYRSNTEWSYAAAALESSSYMKMGKLWQWFTANIGYHHIHHLNCKIPFYRLPEAMQQLPALQKATVTTLYPKDIIACLRLKVWDPELNAMIPLDI